MTSLPKISEAEYKVLKIIWECAPISTNEVTEYLTATSDWSPKTIQTLLKRLVSKRAITYEKQGRVFVYTPLIKEQEYKAQESSSFLKRFYQGSISAMVSAYLEDDALTETDIENLRQLLSTRSKKGGG